jgi:cytochrome c oxidase cbb3-type subunit III
MPALPPRISARRIDAMRKLLTIAVATSCLAISITAFAGDHDAPGQVEPPATKTLSIPLGDVPGAPNVRADLANKVVNPFEGQASAVQDGKVLFQKMNCVYCHQFKGTGLIGPSLANGQWRYGGRPAEIFKSIYEGRPQGMPAWGEAMPTDKIWQVVTYIVSLGGAVPNTVSSQGDLPAKPPTPAENPTVDTEQAPPQ